MKQLALTITLAVLLSACAQKRAVVVVPPPPVHKPGPSFAEMETFNRLLRNTVLHFEFDATVLSDQDKVALQRVAEALRVRTWARIRIAGHCDERGTEEYNLALGQRRADVARQYLRALGVSAAAIETVSFGAELPVVEGATEEIYAVNRRDELQPVSPPLLGLSE